MQAGLLEEGCAAAIDDAWRQASERRRGQDETSAADRGMAALAMSDDRLLSGFMNHDYVLTFSINNPDKRARLVALCEGPWMGDEVTAHTWEISNELSPDQMEQAIIDLLEDGDRVAYYYLTPPLSSGMPGVPDSKRIFRVVIS